MAPAAARRAGRRGPVLLKLAPSSPRPRSSPAAAGGGDVPALTGGRARRAEPAARGCASEVNSGRRRPAGRRASQGRGRRGEAGPGGAGAAGRAGEGPGGRAAARAPGRRGGGGGGGAEQLP